MIEGVRAEEEDEKKEAQSDDERERKLLLLIIFMKMFKNSHMLKYLKILYIVTFFPDFQVIKTTTLYGGRPKFRGAGIMSSVKRADVNFGPT